MIFASEIAAAIGHNKYKDPDEVKISMWKRINPDSFESCLERTKKEWKDHESLVEDSNINTSAAIKEGDESDATKQVGKIMKDPIRICQKHEIVNVKDVLTDGSMSTKNKRTYIKDLIMDTNVTIDRNTKQKVDKAVDKIVISGSSMTDDKIKKELECLKVSDSKQLKKAVNKVVNTKRGSNNESDALEIYEKKIESVVIENNTRFYKKSVGEGVMIGGRIDGLTGAKLVEVKCRRNRFFSFLPKYEKVQIHAYMFLTETTLCDLVQKFNGKIQIDTYEFDEDYWESICNQIISFWADFKDLMEYENEQDELILRSNF